MLKFTVTQQDGFVRFQWDGEERHDSLSVLFERDGVPNNMVMDSANTQIQNDYKKKYTELGCHTIQVEPYSPWRNSCEIAIKMLK